MNNVRETWEQRAVESKSQLSGVLFRGLSERANAAIHAWHAWVVAHIFLPAVARDAHILDLGCGYGRLSNVVMQKRPDIVVTGQDIAFGYCENFLKTTSTCVQGDATRLPFADQSFDGVLAVTCLMYAERTNAHAVLAGLYRVLRPGGAILVLDPGLELQRLIGSIRGSQAASPTRGEGFNRAEYCKLVEDAGFKILNKGGNPKLSLALLFPGIAKSNHPRVDSYLNHKMLGDCSVSGYSRMALHRWLIAVRPNESAS